MQDLTLGIDLGGTRMALAHVDAAADHLRRARGECRRDRRRPIRAGEIAVIQRWLERAFPDEARRDQVRELLMILPNLAKLMGRLAKDPRVPVRAKVLAAAAAFYTVSPIDLVPDFIPVIGRADDIVVVALALDHLVQEAGLSVVREHWDGSDEVLSLTVDLVGMVAGLIPRPVRIAINRYLRG